MAGYVGNVPVPQSVREDQSFTATAGQTTFNTLGYTDGTRIKVFLNGVLLEGGGTDYTATNGSDVVLTSGAIAGDILRFETFNEVQLVNNTSTTPIFKTSATLKNDTEEDTDGGRESTVIFQGEQSGGEISTLAEIEASHDGTADDEKGDLIFRTNDGSDGASPTEAARIDSGQNLLVGTTSTTVYTSGSGGDAGVNLRADGQISNSSNSASVFNRMASDGPINLFYKDGSEVGRIGTLTGSGVALQVKGAVNAQPVDVVTKNSSGSDITYRFHDSLGLYGPDATQNLGRSTARWKDLYLSGGAYIGGTVAANYLDDYEEGHHEMLSGISTSQVINSSYTHMKYTKIGNMVFCSGYFNLSSATSSTTAFQISLPFTSTSTSNSAHGSVGGPSPMHESLNLDSNHIDVVWYIASGGALARLYQTQDNGGWSFLKENDFTTNTSLYFNFNYRTDS
jgi:hypothetical protein